MPTVHRLMLRITFIAFSVAKPFGPGAYSAAETHELGKLCFPRAQMRELCFVEIGEVEFRTSFYTPVFMPVPVLRDLVSYEREMVVHSRFQGHP